MAIKTNKSYTKRIKVSKHGKLKRRRSGHNHFNAKESRRDQLTKKGQVDFSINRKIASRMLPGVKIK
jgi:ribosomal protein L35